MGVFFVAEIGINHNGDMSICKELIDVAADAGCDAVKFQKRDINQVIRRTFWIVRAKAHGVKCSALKKRGWSSASSNIKRFPATVPREALSGLRPLGIPIAKAFCANLTANLIKLLQR